MFLTGCNAPAGTAIELSDIENNEVERREEKNKARVLEDYEKTVFNYADGIYLEDYTEVKNQINIDASRYYRELLKDNFTKPIIFKIDVLLYTKGYEVYKEEEITFKEFSDKYPEYFINVLPYVALFEESGFEEDYKEYVNSFENSFKNVEMIGNPWPKLYGQIFNSSFYDEAKLVNPDGFSIKEWFEKLENLYDGEFSYYNYFGLVDEAELKKSSDDIKIIKEKYNVDVYEDKMIRSTSNKVFEYENIKLNFYTHNSHDEFLKYFYQKAISDYVNKVIEEEGGAEKIGQFSTAETSDDDPIDLRKAMFDIETHLPAGKYSQPSVALYYLLDEEEEIDYEMIKRIINKIDPIFGDERTPAMYVFFYDMSEIDKQTQLKLFKEADHSGFGKPSSGIENWAAGFHVVDNGHDCFDFLYTFGRKRDGMFLFYSNIREDISIDRLIEIYLKKNIWED